MDNVVSQKGCAYMYHSCRQEDVHSCPGKDSTQDHLYLGCQGCQSSLPPAPRLQLDGWGGNTTQLCLLL